MSSSHWVANVGLHPFKHLEETAVRGRWREMGGSEHLLPVPVQRTRPAVPSSGFGMYFCVPVSPQDVLCRPLYLI